MGRVRSRAASAQPPDLSASSPTKQQPHKRRKKNGYKVILESVTQKRKKLRLSASFSQCPPPGYTFVEFGNAKLSAQCKEFCRKRGELAYSVSAPPKNNATVDPEKISYHVNRVGWHFPNKIVDLAAEWLGIQIGRRRSENGSGFTQGLGRRLRAHVNLSEEDRVRAAMRDLFPNMPEDSLEAIVEHAFAEGAKRVGNATNLSLERRVQMAVLAHVRHKHTDYDKLLKEVGYIQARKTVENPCIEKILEWRGENANEDDDVVEMEDDFREVVVLDDSDDNEGGEESDSDSSVEYAPTYQAPAALQSRGHHNISNIYTQSRSRPNSCVEPKATRELGYARLHQRPPFSQRIPHQPEVARPRAPRGYNQPPVELDHDPYARNVVIRDAPPLAYPYERGGRHHPEVSELRWQQSCSVSGVHLFQNLHTHQQLPQQQYPSRRAAEQGSYSDIQRVRVARHDAEPSGGQSMFHHTSGRLITCENRVPQVTDRAAHDARPRGEPHPEDVVVPSIERDDLSSAQPTDGNSSARYISHQERSLMQRPMKYEPEGLQAHRRVEPENDHVRRVPQANVIDLTNSTSQTPKDVRHGNHHFISGSAHEAARTKPSNFSIYERYYDRRPVERDVDPGAKMVGSKEPSLQFLLRLSEQIESRPELDGVERAGPSASRSNQLRHTNLAGDNRSNAQFPPRKNPFSPHLASTSRVANEQIHEWSFTTKRRSGDWMSVEPLEDRSAYAVRRRIEGLQGPGRVLGTVDSPGPSYRPQVPIAVERRPGDPRPGRDQPFMRTSPVRMRLSGAYEDLTEGDVPARQSTGGGTEHPSGPPGHYFDYRPITGDVRRHDGHARSYR